MNDTADICVLLHERVCRGSSQHTSEQTYSSLKIVSLLIYLAVLCTTACTGSLVLITEISYLWLVPDMNDSPHPVSGLTREGEVCPGTPAGFRRSCLSVWPGRLSPSVGAALHCGSEPSTVIRAVLNVQTLLYSIHFQLF